MRRTLTISLVAAAVAAGAATMAATAAVADGFGPGPLGTLNYGVYQLPAGPYSAVGFEADYQLPQDQASPTDSVIVSTGIEQTPSGPGVFAFGQTAASLPFHSGDLQVWAPTNFSIHGS
jgi:hypothetical protein